MRRLGFAIVRAYCVDCQHLIWFWQSRCGDRHSTCKHAGDLAIWSRNDYPVPMWACSYCGVIPK